MNPKFELQCAKQRATDPCGTSLESGIRHTRLVLTSVNITHVLLPRYLKLLFLLGFPD